MAHYEIKKFLSSVVLVANSYSAVLLYCVLAPITLFSQEHPAKTIQYYYSEGVEAYEEETATWKKETFIK